MKKTPSWESKILSYSVFFLAILTNLFSFRFSPHSFIYLFILLFLFTSWQRRRIHQWAARYINLPPSFILFLGISFCWATFFQLSLAPLSFALRPVITLLAILGLYLPYFAIWYRIFVANHLNFYETFFLSGLSGILFQSFISRKLMNTIIQAPNLFAGILFFLLKASATLAVVGALTSTPYLVFTRLDPLPSSTRKVKTYLLAISSFPLAVSIFIIWLFFLKRVIFKV